MIERKTGIPFKSERKVDFLETQIGWHGISPDNQTRDIQRKISVKVPVSNMENPNFYKRNQFFNLPLSNQPTPVFISIPADMED